MNSTSAVILNMVADFRFSSGLRPGHCSAKLLDHTRL